MSHMLKTRGESIRLPWPESEKLPLEYMVKGWTINGAYQMRMEDNIGSIESGKSADFVVLPENLFEANPREIYKMMPDAVVMEGELIQGSLGSD